MKKTDEMYLADILQYAREARSLAAGHDADTFEQNRLLQLALTYLVQIVGEAAANVSDARRGVAGAALGAHARHASPPRA